MRAHLHKIGTAENSVCTSCEEDVETVTAQLSQIMEWNSIGLKPYQTWVNNGKQLKTSSLARSTSVNLPEPENGIEERTTSRTPT